MTTQEVSHECLELDILEDSAQSSRTWHRGRKLREALHVQHVGVGSLG